MFLEDAKLVLELSLSLPLYWTGTLAIYIFAVQLNWLPTSGANNLILPTAVLGFHAAGAIGQVVRAQVADTLTLDFVRTARAKGLRKAGCRPSHSARRTAPRCDGHCVAGWIFARRRCDYRKPVRPSRHWAFITQRNSKTGLPRRAGDRYSQRFRLYYCSTPLPTSPTICLIREFSLARNLDILMRF